MRGKWTSFLKRWIFFGEHRLLELTEDLNLHRFVELLLTWAQHVSGAGNVVWLRQDELARFKEIATGQRAYETDQALYRETKVHALKALADKEIIDLILPIDVESVTVQKTAAAGGFHFYVPICDNRTNKVLAALILLSLPGETSGVRRVSRGVRQVAKHARFCLEHWQAQSETFCDDLTGLFNQKFMAQVLEAEIMRASRANGRFAVLFMDIDHFKAINDHQGHWVGSKVLVELARVIRRHIRKSDYAFRYGGDEFVVILPETSSEAACTAAERIRGLIEATDFLIDGAHLRLTLSIGIAGFPEHAQTHREIIRLADEAMYCGKKSRNIVFVANS